MKILRILRKDSSIPIVEIAKKIGISDATVHLRIKHLIAAGIINKFTISVDNDRLGYTHVAFIGVNVVPGCTAEVTKYLTGLHEILELHEMLSRFDLLLKLRARSLDEMRDIVVNKVRKFPRIVEIELMTTLKTSKEEQIIDISTSE
jgi:Lrp/AsnC family transcriptional regulator, regulator for asnA, asnC and gidA